MKTFLFLISTAGLSALGLAGATYAAAPAAHPIEVALTFDDLPVHGKLPPHMNRFDVMEKILTTLKKNDQHDVFGFINASTIAGISDREEALRLWAKEQRLANHTFSHPDLAGTTSTKYLADMLLNEPFLKKFSQPGQDWKWFRYPFLGEGDTLAKRNLVRKGLKDNGYRIAEVTTDFSDWSWNSPYSRCMAQGDSDGVAELKESYLHAAVSRLHYADQMSQLVFGRSIPQILLMHVGAFDAEMLDDMMAAYRAEGVTFVTLEQAASDPAFAQDPGFASADAETFLSQWMKVKKLPFPAVDKIPAGQLSKTCL